MLEPEKQVLIELRRQTRYLRELASFNRRDELRKSLDDPDKRLAYNLSDGLRSAADVVEDGRLTKSARSVQRWWQEWVEADLAIRMESGSVLARYDAWVIDAGDDGG